MCECASILKANLYAHVCEHMNDTRPYVCVFSSRIYGSQQQWTRYSIEAGHRS